LLSAVLGILIGVIITKLVEGRDTQLALKQAAMIAQLQQAGRQLTETASKITIVPSLDHRMNVLLMGVDSNGRGTKRWANTRSDTMMIVSLDPERKKVGIVSIPRDSRVAIANHGTDKINSAHAIGGPELAVETVQDDFSVPIDHYVVIDAQGLRKVFEALGPIDVLVEKKMHYHDWAGHLHVELEPGPHKLTPEQAEEYVRFRHDPRGDIGRIERQQWFLRQLANKFKEPQVLLKLPELFKIASDYVITDLSPDEMAKIASFGKDIKANQVTSGTVPGRATTINGGSYWEPDYTGAAIVFNRLLGTPMASSVTDNIAAAPSNSAYAATSGLETASKISVTLKYPRGSEPMADAFCLALCDQGYRLKIKIRGDASDCQHEQIVQTSMKADDLLTEKLQAAVPQLASFPVVVSIDDHAPSDFMIVLSPNTVPPVIAAKPEDETPIKKKDQPILIEQAPMATLSDEHRPSRRRKKGRRTAAPSAAAKPDSTAGGDTGGQINLDPAGSPLEPGASAPAPPAAPEPAAPPPPTPSPASAEPAAGPSQ